MSLDLGRWKYELTTCNHLEQNDIANGLMDSDTQEVVAMANHISLYL